MCLKAELRVLCAAHFALWSLGSLGGRPPGGCAPRGRGQRPGAPAALEAAGVFALAEGGLGRARVFGGVGVLRAFSNYDILTLDGFMGT